jgi:hypothetical protein
LKIKNLVIYGVILGVVLVVAVVTGQTDGVIPENDKIIARSP